jgi:hypothetical protein
MRLWSLHPKYLDPVGLVALWREALLAKKVLKGETKGYRNHPQLIRFKGLSDPVSAINAYLKGVFEESQARGYKFDSSKISEHNFIERIPVTSGQLEYEWGHLLAKLGKRSPEWLIKHSGIASPAPHPLFKIAKGRINLF